MPSRPIAFAAELDVPGPALEPRLGAGSRHRSPEVPAAGTPLRGPR